MSFVSVEIDGLDGEYVGISLSHRKGVLEINVGDNRFDEAIAELDADAAVRVAEAILEAVKEIRS